MNASGSPRAERTDEVDEAREVGVDPRDTDHPAGTEHAAENRADESPG